MALKEALEMLDMDTNCLSCCANMIALYLDEKSRVALRAIAAACACEDLPLTPSKIRKGWQRRQRIPQFTPPKRRRKV